jgi:hypothetical protein
MDFSDQVTSRANVRLLGDLREHGIDVAERHIADAPRTGPHVCFMPKTDLQRPASIEPSLAAKSEEGLQQLFVEHAHRNRPE